MVGFELLLIASLAHGCDARDIGLGACASGPAVELHASSPGSGGGGGGSDGDPSAPAPPVPSDCSPNLPTPCRFEAGPPGSVSAFDIASFRAVPGTGTSDPVGWTIAGETTTFTATASSHEVAGTLLARPAVVRFTPVAYLWDFGDGESARAGTTTTHGFHDRGWVTARLTVEYSAEYHWSDSPNWLPVIGTVAVPSSELRIRVYTVTTVLVRGTCIEYPNDPGC